MSTPHTSRGQLLEIISQLKSHYDEAFPGRDAPGLEYITGGAPSRNPRFCYSRWSESSFPVLFENATRSNIEEAFSLWLEGLDEDISESELGEDSEDERSVGTSGYATASEDDAYYYSSDSESECEDEDSTSDNSLEAPAVRGGTASRSSPTFPTSPCKFVDVETDSSSTETDEDDLSSDDGDTDWRPSLHPSPRYESSLGTPPSPRPLAPADDYSHLMDRIDDDDDFPSDLFDDCVSRPRDEQDDDASAPVDAHGSPPPESLFDVEGTPSEFRFDVVGAGFVDASVQGCSSSSSLSGAEANQASTSSAGARGQKRRRADEDEDFAGAGPRTKRKSAREAKGKGRGSFRCTLGDCTEVFTTNSDLKRHIESSEAHATRAFECPGCQSAFVRAEAFCRHFKSEKYANCRVVLCVKAKMPTWTATIARDMLQTCTVPHTPKAGPSREQ